MPNTIPLSLTLLLGREHEIRTLSQLLRYSEVRLVTITGPGGVGKTSLALQVAHDVQDAFTDGVFFISLAASRDFQLNVRNWLCWFNNWLHRMSPRWCSEPIL